MTRVLRHAHAARVPSVVARVALLSVVWLSIAGCEGSGATSTYELAGYVRELGTGVGISGATVTFTSDTRYRSEARTDGDGYYEMQVETDALFGQVRAEHERFQPAESSVYFDTRTRRVDLALRPRRD
ncbi:MAG: carboxypeptidase regulatory-like domain-containing protein [Myxococcales bacterium]|nr:carboxypeptidase regulatory-like domain-containing protein [Myxococcales bacterium]